MASLKLLVGGASAIGASALTSYLLMTDNTVSIIDFIRSWMFIRIHAKNSYWKNGT